MIRVSKEYHKLLSISQYSIMKVITFGDVTVLLELTKF